MEQAVMHARLVDIARLGVGDTEVVVASVFVDFVFELLVQSKYVVHQISLKFLHILLASLAPQKFLPRFEQVFYRNDIVVGMSEQNPRVDPPPAGIFCPCWSISKSPICCGMNTMLPYRKSTAIQLVKE